jgi:GAF domain-containing protein
LAADDHDRLSFLNQVAKLTAAAGDKEDVRLRDVLLTVMNGVKTLLQSEVASILLWDKRHRRLVFVTAAGEANQELAEIEVPLQGSIAGWAIKNEQSVLVDDVQGDPRFFPGVDERTGFTTRTLICAPMVLRGEIIGVLEALNKREEEPFTEADLQLLQEVAEHTARAIEKARHYEDLLRVGKLHQEHARIAPLNPMNPLGR